MGTPVKYKKPRRINVVSVVLVLLVVIGVYAAIQFLPQYMLRQEAHRVLQEASSKIAGRASHYERDTNAREQLHREMDRNLRELGIVDPEMETWIEFEGKELRLGVLYSTWTEWPYGIIPRQESVVEVEHEIVLP